MLRWPQIVMILIVVLVLFGTKSFPEIAHRSTSWERADLDALERTLPWVICGLLLILVLAAGVHLLVDSPAW